MLGRRDYRLDHKRRFPSGWLKMLLIVAGIIVAAVFIPWAWSSCVSCNTAWESKQDTLRAAKLELQRNQMEQCQNMCAKYGEVNVERCNEYGSCINKDWILGPEREDSSF